MESGKLINYVFPYVQVQQSFHCMAIRTTWIFKYSQNFHYCIDEVFLYKLFSKDFSHNEKNDLSPAYYLKQETNNQL